MTSWGALTPAQPLHFSVHHGFSRKTDRPSRLKEFYSAEEIAALSADEINAIINRDLWEDAYKRQIESPKKFLSNKKALHFENFLFLCPSCLSYDTISSDYNKAYCTNCGCSIEFDEYGFMSGIPFRTVRELSLWQIEKVHNDALMHQTYQIPLYLIL